jgi:hypothetical protein
MTSGSNPADCTGATGFILIAAIVVSWIAEWAFIKGLDTLLRKGMLLMAAPMFLTALNGLVVNPRW